MTHPTGWPTAQSICDIPEVRAALDAFAEDANDENMLAMVSAIMTHSPASVRAAALEKARDALEEIALAGMAGSGQEYPEGLRDWHARRAWEFIGIAARAKKEIDATLSAAPAGGLGEMSANENIGRVARKIVASLADSPVSALSNLVQAIQDADAIAAAQGEGK